jgi:hypothetical protein
MYQFLVGIDIPHLGPEAAKALHQYFYGSMEAFEAAVRANFAFSHIAEVPGIVEKSIYRWFEDESNVRMMHAVMAELEFIGMHKELDGKQNPFMDTTVAVTGTFENFTREGILELLATLGAKTTDKVTKDTNYLIYGSVPGNKKVSAAMEYHITILSERDFGKMIERSHKTEKSTTVFSDKYRYCNATITPKINNDSIIRAISITTEMDYGDVFRSINRHKKITGAHYFCSPGHPQDYLSNVLNLERVPVHPDENGTRMTVSEFCDKYPAGRYIVSTGNEWSAVVDGFILDTKDCSKDSVYAYYAVES